MLNDGKKNRGRGRPLSRGGGRGSIIHHRDEPDDREVQGKSSVPPGGEGPRSRGWCQDAWKAQQGVVAWGLRGPPQGDPSRSGE